MTAHVFGEQAASELVAAGIDGIEHGTGVDDATIILMAEHQVALVPTMIQLDNFEMYAQSGEDRFPLTPGICVRCMPAVSSGSKSIGRGRPDLRRH